MELETDKAVIEVPSSVTGTVKEIQVKEGEKVKVGQVIFTLEGGASRQPEKAKHAPVEHISEQHEARALRSTPPLRPREKLRRRHSYRISPRRAPPNAFSMPAQLGKVAGTEHGHPLPRRLMFVVWHEKSAWTFTT